MKKSDKVKFVIDGGYIIEAPKDMTVDELIGKFEKMHCMKSFNELRIPISAANMTVWKDEQANIIITSKRIRLVKN